MIDVFQTLQEAWSYDFIRKALLVGVLIALCCSFLGVFLVLKKFSMIGDGLAHVSFATVAIALLLSAAPLPVSIPLVILASLAILKLAETAELHGDAAIGLVSSFAVAAGVVIASLANGFNVDLMSYLFGSILVIRDADIVLSVILALLVIVAVIAFFNPLFAASYDEEFAQVSGIRVKRGNQLIVVLTAITVALGIRVVGTMLISSLIIFPTVTALQLSRSFKGTIALSSLVSVSCVLVGIFLSFLFDLPTGGTIVMLNAVCFGLFFSARRIAVRA
jgi:zinc transport system permease protein